ncbi:MAG TPA: DUF1579 family protein [Candidatus Acidoferrales bacterium]
MSMKKNMAVAMSVLFVCTFVATVLGQAPSGPPKPGPEHQKLAYFAGKWASEAEMKPSAFGPGGKFAYTETCEWFSGGFALVCHTDGKMQEGTFSELSIMGYDPGEKTYVYFETTSYGENVFSRGTEEGGTWTWTSESKMNGKAAHARFTLKQVSADSSTFKFEIGMGDEPLKVVMEGKQTRVK